MKNLRGAALSVVLAACSSEKAVAPATAERSLVLVRERKLSKILSRADHYEASGVTVSNGMLRVVFDNLGGIGTVALDFSTGSMSVGASSTSQYESITAGGGFLYVGKEQQEAVIDVFDDNGVFLREETTDLSFPASNSALEGLAYLNETHLVAMGEKDGGKVYVLEKRDASWHTVTSLLLPATFADYADIGLLARSDGSWSMAVVSQESAKVWLGRLAVEPYRIDGSGTIYAMDPKYCELEGIAFLDPSTLVMVSDKSSDGACKDEDESVHIFAIR